MIGSHPEFPGWVVMGSVHRFKIEKIDHQHVGRKRVVIAEKLRDNALRHQIVKLTTPTGKFVFLEVIGRSNAEELVLGLDRDDRTHLGIKLGEELDIEVTRCGVLGQFRWFVGSNEPNIRLTAWLALISVVLGVLSLLISFHSTR
jgi:hypothetical protein